MSADDQWSQVPPEALQAYTEFNMWSSAPGDINAFPKSGALYNEMVTKFGAHNIHAPPDWITTDEGRKQWVC